MEFKEPSPARNIPPSADYRAEIAAHLRATLKDPSSIRDAMIGEPQQTWMGVAYRYTVCVRMNAKNSYGGYAGPQDHLVVFLDGRPFSVQEALSVQCGRAAYAPYPELMATARSAR
jgi:hypothetical protein